MWFRDGLRQVGAFPRISAPERAHAADDVCMTDTHPTSRCATWREAILSAAFFALLVITPFVI